MTSHFLTHSKLQLKTDNGDEVFIKLENMLMVSYKWQHKQDVGLFKGKLIEMVGKL